MFDKDLHKEYIFCRYLAHLLPGDDEDKWNLGNKVTLEYYKLEETYTGSIALDKDLAGEYEPATICLFRKLDALSNCMLHSI